jgi:hypothetical protein
MSQRGVLYIAWDTADAGQTALLERAVASLREVHPELAQHVARLPGAAPHIEKAGLGALTPFQTTAYLDVDTVVLGRLDFAFEMAERHGLACCHGANPWRRRYLGVVGDAIEYDTGVLFFGQAAQPVLEAWRELAPALDLPVCYAEDRQAKQAPCDDRLAFGHAVEQRGLAPVILPRNWNLQPRWHTRFFGPVKIWHDRADVPETVLAINRYYQRDDAMIQFHALDGAAQTALPAYLERNR